MGYKLKYTETWIQSNNEERKSSFVVVSRYFLSPFHVLCYSGQVPLVFPLIMLLGPIKTQRQEFESTTEWLLVLFHSPNAWP